MNSSRLPDSAACKMKFICVAILNGGDNWKLRERERERFDQELLKGAQYLVDVPIQMWY